MASKKDWKLEAWKAAVSLTEKVFLVFLGTLVIPLMLQKGPFPAMIVIFAVVFSIAILSIWLVLILRIYKRNERIR